MSRITPPKKPFPVEVEFEDKSERPVTKEEKLSKLARELKKSQEEIQILRLELSDKDRVIKEIADKM